MQALHTVLSQGHTFGRSQEACFVFGSLQALAEKALRIRSLRHLDVAGNGLGAAGFQALAEALAETSLLESLDIGSNDLGPNCAEALQKLLLGTKTLKDFRAAHNALGDAGAKVVAECLDSDRCAIERLSLVANGIGQKGFKALASSRRHHAAVQLHISGNFTNLHWRFRMEAATDLSRCFRLMDVVAHDDDKSTARDKAQEVRQALREGNVEIFWKKGCKASRRLAAALQGPSRLQVLHVDKGYDVEAAALEALEGHVALKSLVLDSINGSLSEALGFALDGRSGLEELVVQYSFTHLNPEGMQALASALKGLAALKVLYLSHSDLGDDGAKVLAPALQGLAALKVLDLERNDLGHDGAKALAESLTGMSLLEELRLRGNKIGSEGAQVLAPALQGLAALKVLDLERNDLGHDGAKALAESLTGMSLLEELRLRGNKIGSEGAQAGKSSVLPRSPGQAGVKQLRSGKQLCRQALAPALKGLAALKDLYLSGNDLGDDGEKARRGRTTSMSVRF
ncbi:NLRC3 [Symbiodinium necroappetens]|uniref:NLRC3 protein n=1 Tax=Symbiodinium necroappetens TaxID=1628268 RepID=A0A812UV09_9DINO|nr:NLRC3 [Symbiodinium necroappetens]